MAFTGQTAEEMLGAGWTSVVHPDDVAEAERLWRDAVAHGKSFSNVHRIRRRDGEWRWMNVYVVPIRDETGQIVEWFGMNLDITDRKRAEDQLRALEVEAQWKSLVEQAPDGIFVADLEARYTDVNTAGCLMLGYEREEIVGKTILDLIPDDRAEQLEREKAQLLRGEEVVSDWVLRKKDGTWLPVEVSAKILPDGRWQGFVRDISERKRLEAALRASHAQQKFLAEVGEVLATTLEYEETLSKIGELAVRHLADVCIVEIVDADGELRRFRALAGEPAKQWVAEAMMRFRLDRKRPHLGRSVVETKQPLLIENVTPDLIASWAQSDEHLRVLRGLDARSVVAVPLLSHRKLLGVVALISSTRAYGPTDLQLANELAHRAALSIENAQLYGAATRAIQVRDDVLGIVAHDLRNPLSSIVMQASMLRQRGNEPERRSRRPAEAIERAAKRMNRLIQDLLDVTRMEAGHLVIKQSRLRTQRVVADALEAQRPLAATACLELHVDMAPNLPDVWADRDRLLQVFENLIGNAVKFTEPGGRITAGAAPRDAEVLFWVADTGAGIVAEDVPHLFDRFWQAPKAGTPGAGLGLPIVKGIVEAHGGRIWVKSALGRGSTFLFTIPVATGAEEWRAEDASQGA